MVKSRKKRDNEKPKIITLLKKGNEIIEMEIKCKVKKIGRTGYISVPKELIGKYVKLNFKKRSLDKELLGSL